MKLLLITDRFTILQQQTVRNLLLSASNGIVYVSDTFDATTRDIQFIILNTVNGKLSIEDNRHVEASDLSVCVWVTSDEKFSWKIIKDRKKSVVRDVSQAEFFFTLGKYRGFELEERNKQYDY